MGFRFIGFTTDQSRKKILKIKTCGFGDMAAVAFFGTLIAGCASTASKPQQSSLVNAPYYVDADDNAKVSVEATGAVVATSEEKEHLRGLVTDKLNALRVKNPSNGEVRECSVVVTITRFDKGNAFARAMLAGLGQIHLGADVAVTDGDNKKLQAFSVDKTFAWGGIYGASTHIEDVEPALADGIAMGLTGQKSPDDKPKK
jgi:hypothetical protein